MDDKQRARVVEAARAAVDAAGGLVTPEQLAREWGVTSVAIGERIKRGRFPLPVAQAGRVRLYLRAEVEPFRRPV